MSIDEENNLLQILPIPELASLYSSTFSNITVTNLTQVGSQFQAVLTCSGVQRSITAGAFGLDVLATASAREYTRLGVNLTRGAGGAPAAFVDTSQTAAEAHNSSACCSNPGTNVMPLWQLHGDNIAVEHGGNGASIVVTVLVDGGMIEAFFGNQCPVTTLVQPSSSIGPELRFVRPFNTAIGVNCNMRVSRLISLKSDDGAHAPASSRHTVCMSYRGGGGLPNCLLVFFISFDIFENY
eukprot:SAG31_NODE_2760_length_5133_cov_12.708582_3_plen_239_part_00